MKKSKNGVSLIVLVITIIVIIIIAAAVILGLNNNNPINSSKISSAAQLKDSVASTVNMYLSKEIARTRGVYSAEEIMGAKAVTADREGITLPEQAKKIISDATKTYVITSTDEATKGMPAGTYYEINIANFKTQTEFDLAKASVGPAGAWYVDPITCTVIYKLTSAGFPGWMMTDGKPNTDRTNLDKSLTFVQ